MFPIPFTVPLLHPSVKPVAQHLGPTSHFLGRGCCAAMGFLRNHKKISTQPLLDAENAKIQIHLQTETSQMDLGIPHSFSHGFSRGLRNWPEADPRAGGNGGKGGLSSRGGELAGRKSPTSRRRRRLSESLPSRDR